MNNKLIYKILSPIIIISLLTSCNIKDEDSSSDIEEIGQQVGDIMASMDESSGSNSGTYAALSKSYKKTVARILPKSSYEKIWDKLKINKSFAESCSTATTFSSCSSNVINRNFSDCTIGLATIAGSVSLTFDDAATDNTCALTTNGHSITRNPNFTITGLRGATIAVAKTGTVGQKVTRGASAGAFSFSNDGINRTLTLSAGSKLFDFTTRTTTDIAVTGTSRADRIMNTGTLEVTNNLTGVTCDVSPSNVTWTSTCNCASSGTWSGSCSDDTDFSLDITSCGAGSLTIGSDSQSFSFDRCFSN